MFNNNFISLCRYVAGLRFIVDQPLMTDNLAGLLGLLCGSKGLELAQGGGKHLRVPARSRIVDGELLSAIRMHAQHGATDAQVSSSHAHSQGPWKRMYMHVNGVWEY